MSSFDLIASFLVTWIVVLVPPTVLRLIWRRPWGRSLAITASVILYFANIVLFTALGSTSKSHGALIFGAVLSFAILRWHTAESAAKEAAAARKKLGYDP